MTFSLTIECHSDAFRDPKSGATTTESIGREIHAVLSRMVDTAGACYSVVPGESGHILDSDGYRIGTWSIVA